jgi:hypothetical protein
MIETSKLLSVFVSMCCTGYLAIFFYRMTIGIPANRAWNIFDPSYGFENKFWAKGYEVGRIKFESPRPFIPFSDVWSVIENFDFDFSCLAEFKIYSMEQLIDLHKEYQKLESLSFKIPLTDIQLKRCSDLEQIFLRAIEFTNKQQVTNP